MKSLVGLVIALLAAGAYAADPVVGNITGASTSAASPGLGYVYDEFTGGSNESRNIIWNDAAESTWDNGHRDVAQTFILDTAQELTGFSWRLDPRGTSDYAYYMPSGGREIQVSLIQLGTGEGSDYILSMGEVKATWTGTLTNALNNPAANSWLNLSFDTSYTIEAGVNYALQVGMASMLGTNKWDSGYVSFGVFNPSYDDFADAAGQWAIYTGSAGSAPPPYNYYKTWRSGRFELVPEPATLALLGLGGLLLRRRGK